MGRTAADFFPGPICRQLPRLVDAFSPAFELMTTNYDDLPEQAMRAKLATSRPPGVGQDFAPRDYQSPTVPRAAP